MTTWYYIIRYNYTLAIRYIPNLHGHCKLNNKKITSCDTCCDNCSANWLYSTD